MKTEDDKEPSVLEYAVILILSAVVTMAIMPFVKLHKATKHRKPLDAFSVAIVVIIVGIYWLAFVR